MSDLVAVYGVGKGQPMLVGMKVYPPAEYLVADYTEDEENVNAHSDLDLDATERSMTNFGQVETLVVDVIRKKVIGGNGRLRRMKANKWETFWAFGVEGTRGQLATLAIALNKTGRMSEFDFPKLVAKLQELQHDEDANLLALTGFPNHELEPLLASEMHLPDVLMDSDDPDTGALRTAKRAKDLESRGITIQFSTTQKLLVDAAIAQYRADINNFGETPSNCLTAICEQYITSKKLE